MRVDPSDQATALQAVSRAADATGVDFTLLLETAKRESGLDKDARAATSSAAGLFQFIDATWLSLVDRYGAKHGLTVDARDPGQRGAILDMRYDPATAALMAGELARENAAVLEAKLGRAPEPGEIYAAHVLGPARAAQFIKAAAAGAENAAALDPAAAAANRSIFYDRAGGARSAAEVLAELDLDMRTPAITAPGAPASAPTQAARPAATGPFSAFASITPLHGFGVDGFDLWALAMRAYWRGERG